MCCCFALQISNSKHVAESLSHFRFHIGALCDEYDDELVVEYLWPPPGPPAPPMGSPRLGKELALLLWARLSEDDELELEMLSPSPYPGTRELSAIDIALKQDMIQWLPVSRLSKSVIAIVYLKPNLVDSSSNCSISRAWRSCSSRIRSLRSFKNCCVSSSILDSSRVLLTLTRSSYKITMSMTMIPRRFINSWSHQFPTFPLPLCFGSHLGFALVSC